MDRTSDLRTVKVSPAPFSDSKLKFIEAKSADQGHRNFAWLSSRLHSVLEPWFHTNTGSLVPCTLMPALLCAKPRQRPTGHRQG